MKNKHLIFFAIVMLVFFQLTDYALVKYDRYLLNQKVFFGLFFNNLIAYIVFCSFLLCFFLFFNSKKKNILFVVLAVAMTSNIVDRLLYGGVIDYISIWSFPVFNLADVAITISISALTYFSLVRRGEITKKPLS